MPNINDIDPSQLLPTTEGPPVASSGNIFQVSPDQIQTAEQFQEQKYGTPGQQALTVAEGVGQGLLGPVATAAESRLTKMGVKGLSPEDQAARASVNPVERYGSEVAGFGAGALTGTGEAALVSKIGEGAVGLTGLARGASAISKIAATGVKVGSELAALQAGDEISKSINQDPNQTLGSAAINIGLSGILGGAGGMVLGSVSPLFKTAANKLGISKLATDYMGETKFLQETPDLYQGAAHEITGRMLETQGLKSAVESTPLLSSIPRIENILTRVADSEADLFPKLTSHELGERIADPDKLQTLISQVNQGKGTLKVNAVKNYLDATQKLADAVAKAHIESEFEAPVLTQLNPTPILDHSLNTPLTPGKVLAQWANKKGAEVLANALGEGAAGTVGGVAGSLVGHPLLGAWAAEKILSPTFSALAKPFAENAVNSEAMRSAVDYVANAVKGDAILTKSVKDFFRSGEVIPKFLIPSVASRAKLEKSLENSDNPEFMLRVGGNIAHYLPDHSTAATALAASATGYLKTLKPRRVPQSPFDTPPPVDKAAVAKYNRALDVAQQPLLVLKYAKEGTLLPQDVQTLQTIYPGLHSQIVRKINNELIERETNAKPVPYAERLGLSLLTGSVLDSTMAPLNMQAVIRSAGQQQAAVSANKAKNSKATGAQLKAIEKSASLYPTSLQQHQLSKRD